MKELKKWIVLLAALFVLTGMMSCEMFGEEDDDDIAVEGTWDAGYGSEVVITDSTYSNYYNDVLSAISAKIVSFDNDGWNGSETGSGDYGYMVIKYTQASAFTPESQDKYMVVRWQDILSVGDLETMSYSMKAYGSNLL